MLAGILWAVVVVLVGLSVLCRHRSKRLVTTVSKPTMSILGRDSLQCLNRGFLQRFMSFSSPQESFEFRKRLLDR
jgi:hypothetical protein